jgi:hypothetical protein
MNRTFVFATLSRQIPGATQLPLLQVTQTTDPNPVPELKRCAPIFEYFFMLWVFIQSNFTFCLISNLLILSLKMHF